MGEQKKKLTTKDRLVYALIVGCIVVIIIGATLWLFSFGETLVVTDSIDFDTIEDMDEWLTSEYVFTLEGGALDLLELDAIVLRIDWPYTILITDAFSQTTVIAGPATVRFGEEE